MRAWASGLVALLLLLAPLALADQRDPRLDSLFGQLQATSDSTEAARLDREIWAIWLKSGDGEIDRMMEQGMIAMASQTWPVAVTAFSGIVAQRPEFAEGWNKRATLYFMMGRFDHSARDVERTLELEPRHYGALSGMGLIEIHRQRFPEALEWFRRALAVNPHLEGIRAIMEQLELKVKGRPT